MRPVPSPAVTDPIGSPTLPERSRGAVGAEYS
jgi:hypothetical protein